MVTEGDILARAIEAENDSLSPESARFVLKMRLHPNDHRRIEELAERSNQGTLSDEERVDLERYNRVRLLLIKLKSDARRVLGVTAPAESPV